MQQVLKVVRLKETLNRLLVLLENIEPNFNKCWKKSAAEANRMLAKSAEVRAVIEKITKRLKEKNRESYKYTLTTEVFRLRAEIIRMYQELLTFINQDIQANAKSFGRYLTPEQINDFLDKAPTEMLAKLTRRRFSSAIQPSFVTKDEIMTKGSAYLQRKSTTPELSSPPTAEIKRIDVTVNIQEGAAVQFYRELLAKLDIQSPIPLKEVIIKDTFGESLYHAGLLVTVRRELADFPDKRQIDIHLNNKLLAVNNGPVELITDGQVISLPISSTSN